MNSDGTNRTAFELLLGKWKLTRQTSNGYTAKGSASIQPFASAHQADPQLLYEEQGTLDGIGPFTKRYLYRLTVEGIVITHADKLAGQTSFQTLNFVPATDRSGALIAEAQNLCLADTYRSHYELRPHFMAIRHVVSGPRKTYAIDTTLIRS